MAKSREIHWKINAYTRETMPLARLADYLRELASMLGEEPHVHLVRVDTSSTVPVMLVDDESAERVHARAAAVRYGTAPREAMKSYRNINRMLSEDRGTAILYENSAEIIPFPGRDEPKMEISGVKQQGSLDGKLLKVGGPKEWVPVQLQMPDETSMTGCYAKRSLAKEMAGHLFEPMRLYGRGRWNRSLEGEWQLDRFAIDTFELLSAEPLTSVVATLRSISADWHPDAIATLHSIRHGNDEDE